MLINLENKKDKQVKSSVVLMKSEEEEKAVVAESIFMNIKTEHTPSGKSPRPIITRKQYNRKIHPHPSLTESGVME